METLIAYIPVLNDPYIRWIRHYEGSKLYLVPQSLAEELLPRLARQMIGISTNDLTRMILSTCNVEVYLLDDLISVEKCVMPDQDISHILLAKGFVDVSDVHFDNIWARWDMSMVQSEQPVIADVEESFDAIDMYHMQVATHLKAKSPDWFRQIGAVAFRGLQLIASAYNTHMPNEYEAYVFGDPALNRDAGKDLKVSLALHAEQAIVSSCAKNGKPLIGASLYVTTFPCPDCARLIANAGFTKVFFREGYSVLAAQETLRAHGVKIIRVR